MTANMAALITLMMETVRTCETSVYFNEAVIFIQIMHCSVVANIIHSCFHLIQKLLLSCLLTETLKIKMYKTVC
jgi:hypothetical protein